MVALSGGLIFSFFVFMLARDATRFYQNESRVADATSGTIAGFQRLRLDIARAGYLSTPNIRTDLRFCGDPIADGTLGGLQALASLQIAPGGSPAHFSFTKNLVSPDSVNLMGSYDSPDRFPIRVIIALPNNTYEVHFQPTSPAMLRLGYNMAAGANTAFSNLFLSGRVLRITDKTGRDQYGFITGPANVGTPSDPFIILAAAPIIKWKAAGNSCGLRGTEFGSLVNVVQMIHYELRSLSTATQFAPIYPAGNAQAVGEAPTDRTELVREERDINAPANVLANTSPELVAEFAVDLKFGLTVLSDVTTRATKFAVPTDIPKYSGIVSSGSTDGFGPGQIRAVRTRLSVRSRTADRRDQDHPFDATFNTATSARYRFDVTPSGTPSQFARVRSLQADIALRNQPSSL
jgi:hypothetical protein